MPDPNPNSPETPAAPPPVPATAVTATPPPAPATGVTATAPPAPPKPALPPKPAAPPKAPAKGGKDRRFFLLAMFGSWFATGWTTLTAALIGMVLMTLRFLVPNSNSDPSTIFKASKPDDYAKDTVTAYKEQGTWIVRADDEKGRDILYALSTTCTHLGCTPNWLDDAKKFKCPCHGSGFYITGVNFEGPAPRPLERWSLKIADDGKVLVDKSKKFQKELGQWDDDQSFIKMS